MLVLKVKKNGGVVCGVGSVKVLETRDGFVRLGFDFPRDVLVCPVEDVPRRMEETNRAQRFARLKVAGGTRDAA